MTNKLKRYAVAFVVQAYDLYDALNQAEAYLNTINYRIIDCNVNEADHDCTIVPAPRLEDEG